MMTGQSIKIRTKWSSATTAKIIPATKENVFSSMNDHPKTDLGYATLGQMRSNSAPGCMRGIEARA
jgi:hypothetical protein